MKRLAYRSTTRFRNLRRATVGYKMVYLELLKRDIDRACEQFFRTHDMPLTIRGEYQPSRDHETSESENH